MSKTTNKHQIELLLNLMQTHRDIACGFFRGSREDLNRFWVMAEGQLNSAGPPSKSIAEWKKVWLDQKKYVRNKAAKNLKASKGTGGGPNVEQKFSPTEEAIFNLIGMKESVDGVASKFGLGSSVVTTQQAPECPMPQEVDVVTMCFEEFNEVPDPPPLAKQKEKSDQNELPAKKRSSTDVLADALNIQREVSDEMKYQSENNKKLRRSIDRLYDLHKHHYEAMKKGKKEELEERRRHRLAKEEEIKEQRRHNLVMEELRLKEVADKIEKNRRLLEIEDMKYNRDC